MQSLRNGAVVTPPQVLAPVAPREAAAPSGRAWLPAQRKPRKIHAIILKPNGNFATHAAPAAATYVDVRDGAKMQRYMLTRTWDSEDGKKTIAVFSWQNPEPHDLTKPVGITAEQSWAHGGPLLPRIVYTGLMGKLEKPFWQKWQFLLVICGVAIAAGYMISQLMQ